MTGKALLGLAVGVGVLLGLAAALRPRRVARGAVPPTGPAAGGSAAGGAGASFPGLAPALAALLAEVDAAFPTRNRASDGGAPSAAHHAANPHSDHERGDAYDLTADWVNGPDPGALAELARRDPRVLLVIWDEKIANKTIQNNAWRKYERTAVQTDPHTSHVHVSVRHDAREDVRPWGAASLRRESIS